MKKYAPHILFVLLTLLSNSLYVQKSWAQPKILINPPCTNTVCVNAAMRDVSTHSEVVFDAMPSFYKELHHEPECVLPRETGVTVYKQIPKAWVEFPDRFCTNQGCSPVGTEDGAICE